jgi:hypothetical protein
MKKLVVIKCQRLPCELCNKVSTKQIFYRKDGTPKYARARHYIGKVNGKPQFQYHTQTIQYLQRKLNEMQKIDKPNTLGHNGHKTNNDLDKAKSPQFGCISENKAWVSSSARIEHQPPKLGVEGSNPSPPATQLEIDL